MITFVAAQLFGMTMAVVVGNWLWVNDHVEDLR
jgi:hypothetical protein